MIIGVVHILDLSTGRNMEAASRYKKARDATRFILVHGRGDLADIRDELIKPNRERTTQCARDQQSDFFGITHRLPPQLQSSAASLPVRLHARPPLF